jgi:energy-coupling factor transporter ATP-binding protein EcfA2
MQLQRAHIKNFRSIKDTRIDFEPRCRILVGINESGKSNIIRALSLLDPTQKVLPEDLRDVPPDEDHDQSAFVRFVFTLDKQERTDAYKSCLNSIALDDPKSPLLIRRSRRLSLAQLFEQHTESLYTIDLHSGKRYATTWQLPGDDSPADEWYVPIPTCPADLQITLEDGTRRPLAKFRLIHARIIQAMETVDESHFKPASLKAIHGLITEAISGITTDRLPACLYWSYSDAHLLPGQIPLDPFAANPSNCEPLKQMFALAGIDEINEAIQEAKNRTHGVRNLLNRVADRATSHMRSVWKDCRSITIALEPNGSNIDASIKDEHNVYNFAKRSDGFKRFITFLLLVSAKARTQELVDTLYLHDEPDTGLHPAGSRYLLNELIKISAHNYVVFSTHSIFMVDRELTRRHLIVEKKSEITDVKEVDDSNITDEEVIYNALGYSLFENLKSMNLIFEGWRDKVLFQTALRSSSGAKTLKKAFASMGLCHAKGVKDIGRITPMLELARRDWVVISDGDCPAIEQQRKYNGSGPWIRYDEILANQPAMTGEDFVKPQAFQPALDAIRANIPTLPELPVSDLAGSEPKLLVVRRWLEAQGIGSNDAKRLIESLKERVFTNLKPSHIEDKYFLFLSGLKTRLGKNSSRPCEASGPTA